MAHENTGRGPTRARASIRDDVVAVVLQETLLKSEHSLIEDGKGDLVVEMRRSFQQTMREDLTSRSRSSARATSGGGRTRGK